MGKNLPKNWVETELGKILKLKNGYAFKTKDYREEGVPLIRIGNIQQGCVSTENSIYVDENELAKGFIVEKEDVLVAMSGATTGKYGIFNEDIIAYQNQRVGNLKPFVPELTSRKFIYYLLGGLKKEIEEKAYGGAQPNISSKLIETLKFNLPPLKEQERIVAKLDEIFKHLDILKTRLETIPKLLKNFKQAVLTQAVTGKLTQEWRKGKELEEWKTELAKDCCEKVQSGGTPKGSNFSKSGIPFFKVYNIVNQKISFDYRPQFVSEEIQNSQCKKSICFTDDVLMNIVGPPLNKVAIVPEEFPECNINQAITLFRVKEYLNNKYLYYFLCEGTPVNKLVNETRGVVGQVNISLTQCREFQISIPPKEEQIEIVKRVENLFAKADKIEAQYVQLKEKIDSLPQAILAKAFKGELVPQLPTDGDAKELLAEIQKLKETSLQGKKEPVKRKVKN